MKSAIAIIFLLFFCKPRAGAQHLRPNPWDISQLLQEKNRQRAVDSVKQELEKAQSDAERIRLLNQLTTYFYPSSYDSVLYYAARAKEMAEKQSDIKGKIMAIVNRGVAEEIFNTDWDAAIRYYRQAIGLALQYKEPAVLHRLYGVVHNAYVYKGNFPMAMEVARDGLKLASRTGDNAMKLHYTSLAAAAYHRQGIYDKALEEYKQAEKIAFRLNSAEKREAMAQTDLPDIYSGLGDVYTALGDTAMALQLLGKARKGFADLRQTPGFLRGYMLVNVIYKTGMVYKLSGNLDRALRYFEDALDSTARIACNPYEKAGYYLQAGEVLRLKGDRAGAKLYLREGLRISLEIKHAENLRDACLFLSRVYADERLFDSAWYYNQRFMVLKDSITSAISKFRTEEIKAIYDISEKNNVIARQANTRNILIASFAVLLLSLGFLYNRYHLRQKNRHQLELNRQQIELFNGIAAAQEQERKRIAQDIHDGLGSVLSAARLKMTELREFRPELFSDEKFLSGIGLLDEASSELRHISHNIMPATLSKLGLAPALKNLADKISTDKGLQVRFIEHGLDKRLEEQMEISIYRIILELINNVVKHAAATRATVQLVIYKDYINITVEDNGTGFDTAQLPESRSGIGLGNVAARVEYLSGKLDIDSRPGKGTTVIVDIPVPG